MNRRRGPYVLDTGALLAIEGSPTGEVARKCRTDTRRRQLPLLPTTVFAQAWRGSPRQHALAEVRRHCVSLPFTDSTADDVGRLLARSRTSDVVDAAVVLAAIEHDAEVITSDPDDLAQLADALGYRLSLLTV